MWMVDVSCDYYFFSAHKVPRTHGEGTKAARASSWKLLQPEMGGGSMLERGMKVELSFSVCQSLF